jgi:hypothetical protein
MNEKFIKPYSYHHSDKSDDELLYGGN